MSATLATEDILIIETPERVPLHFALASIGNRFLACAIDHAIQVLSIGLIALAAAILMSFPSIEQIVGSAPKWVLAVMILVLFLILAGYFAFFEWAWSGQTPGKRWLKLRVIREDGRPITFWEAAVRNFAHSRYDARAVLLHRLDLCVFDEPRSARWRHGGGNGCCSRA